MTVLEKEKQDAQVILSSRRSLKSGKRLSLEGKHLISTEEVYQEVREAEMRTEGWRNKRRKRAPKESSKVPETFADDESNVEILDSITIERCNE